jgi:hypothetical protein
MIRERIPRQDPQPPFWVGVVLALAICVPFWAAFTWLVGGLV